MGDELADAINRGLLRAGWGSADADLGSADVALIAADVARESLPDAETVARMFHEEYERRAGDFNYETRVESAVPWENVPEKNRALMVATAGAVLRRLIMTKAG